MGTNGQTPESRIQSNLSLPRTDLDLLADSANPFLARLVGRAHQINPAVDYVYRKYVYHMGQKLQDGKKSALRVTKQPSLQETSWPNSWSQQLALLDS